MQQCQNCQEGWLDASGRCTVCSREDSEPQGQPAASPSPAGEARKPIGTPERPSSPNQRDQYDWRVLEELGHIKDATRTIRNVVVIFSVIVGLWSLFFAWILLEADTGF